MEAMKPDRKPLPYPIPTNYTKVLKIDLSFISHVNAGMKPLPLSKCLLLLKEAQKDPYWVGVDLVHDLLLRLHPELTPILPFLIKPQEEKPREQRKLSAKPR